MKITSRVCAAGIFLLLLSGCDRIPVRSTFSADAVVDIYPDYKGVTIPSNIAPLNFHYDEALFSKALTSFSVGSKQVDIRGLEVKWHIRRWRKFISDAEGDTITVISKLITQGNLVEDQWQIFVSADSMDRFLTYRLIEPSYQMWNEVKIVERNIESFKEKVICDHLHTDNSCMNCHIHVHQRGDLSMFYIRGPKGGAILNNNGKLRKLSLRTDEMLTGTVYGEIHPEGRFGVFSTNVVIPGLHSLPGKRMEVYDTASDLAIVDFENNQIDTPPHVTREDRLETFPCFSADGNLIFYCVADTISLPVNIKNLKYSLVQATFDPDEGCISEQVDTIWNGPLHNASVCHPKTSPDGQWIMFTVASYGTFPINHNESTLHLLNLSSKEDFPLKKIKSDHSDTYHSWSSNSRWFVFTSKRGDGQYGKPYFCHLDENGNPGKPFVLPQRAPRFYEYYLKSFNIPDIGSASTGLKTHSIKRIFEANSESFQ